MIPTGTRGVGYLARLLKPDIQCQQLRLILHSLGAQLNRFETDNQAAPPDRVKVAIILNETNGPPQQHLQLQAGTNPTYSQVRTAIMEHYKSITAFSKMQVAQSSTSRT